MTIRAEILPDDPAWNTGRMPTLIHTMPLKQAWNSRPDPLGGVADGMLIETSHVSVMGLKILGLPVVETPQTGQIRRLYGINRNRRDLDDLEVAHCVFRGMKINVVYWTPGSSGHALTHCVCDGLYGSAVWTAGIGNDFDHGNNVVSGCNYVWTAQGGASALADAAGGRGPRPAVPSAAKAEPVHYKVIDSYFGSNRRLAGSGTGAITCIRLPARMRQRSAQVCFSRLS